VAKGDIILVYLQSAIYINLSIVEYNMSLFISDSLPRGSYVDDRNNPPIISATYLLFTIPFGDVVKNSLDIAIHYYSGETTILGSSNIFIGLIINAKLRVF
jgi:hypothetical protein